MEKPTIKKVAELLTKLREKDQEAFDSLLNYNIPSQNTELPIYSLLSILNEIFGTDQVKLGVWFDKKTLKSEKIMLVDKDTYDLIKRNT